MPDAPERPPRPAVVLFDGDCNFCNGSVNFLLRRDKHRRLAFAPLQSGAGQVLLREFNLTPGAISTMVLVDKCSYLKSTAAIRALMFLGGPWRLAAVFLLVPRFLRDAAYDIFAAYRYRLFGKAPACVVPTRDIRDRFLA